MKSRVEVLKSVQAKIRLLHYAYSTEQAYCHWIGRIYPPACWLICTLAAACGFLHLVVFKAANPLDDLLAGPPAPA